MNLDIQSKLPDGWRWVRLGDHATKVGSGITPLGGQTVYSPSGVPLVRSQNVHMNRFARSGLVFISAEQDAEMESSRVYPDDVLLNITGASIGRVCVIPPELCPANVNQHVSIIRCDGSIDPGFLSYYMSTPDFQKFIMNTQAGATRQALTKTLIEEFQIPLPSLDEQKRITAILNHQMVAVERACAAVEAQLDAANTLPAAYLRAVFNSPEAQGWPRASIGSISSSVIDGPHVTPEYMPQGIPFLTVRNIVHRKIDFSDINYISSNDHAEFTRRGKTERGDILYTKDGTLGIPCVVETDIEFSFFVSVALIKLRRELSAPHFVAFALESPAALDQVKLLGAGAGLKHMVLKSIRSLEIPLPPLPMQQRIAATLSEQTAGVELLQQSLHAQLDAINKLPAALLRRAFRGELR